MKEYYVEVTVSIRFNLQAEDEDEAEEIAEDRYFEYIENAEFEDVQLLNVNEVK